MKKQTHQISKTHLKTGARKCLLGALELSGYAKDIVDRGANTAMALGLYSFAIEEYGKYLIFSELLKKDSQSYLVSEEIFSGKKSHDIKFKKAFNDLPPECTSYHSTGPVSFSNIKSSKPEKQPRQNIVQLFSIDETMMSFEDRMSCFHLHWNEGKNRWNVIPTMKNDALIKIITVFEETISKKIDAEHDTEK